MTDVRNPGYYNRNEGRAWPLDDAATGVDDSGRFLPHGILADLQLRFPAALGERAFLTACTVTPKLVTVLFAAESAGYTPLAACSLARPVDVGRPYPLEALAEGVGGWVAFGAGAAEPYVGRFAAAAQGLVAPHCARPYRALPVSGIAKPYAATALADVVEFRAGSDMRVSAEATDLGPTLTLGLAESPGRDVQSLYAGPCRARPEERNCSRPAVETINGVPPDCAGEFELHFRNVLARPLAGGGGVVLDLALGLADACAIEPEPEGLPGTYRDPCAESSSSSLGAEILLAPRWTLIGDSDGAVDCVHAPYGVVFLGSALPAGWTVEAGRFEPTPGSVRAAHVGMRNVAVWSAWNNCGDETPLGKRATARLRLAPGVRSNGGLVLDHHVDPASGRPRYFLALLNRRAQSLELWAYLGTGFTLIKGVPAGGSLRTGRWYDLRADYRELPDAPGWRRLEVRAADLALDAVVTGAAIGRPGLGTIRAAAEFHDFSYTDISDE